LFILALCLGNAAWNGVNFAMTIYLLFSAAGFLGLFAGFRATNPQKRVSSWVTCVSSFIVVCLAAILATSFICCRTPGVPVGEEISFGFLHLPILLPYGWIILCCLIEIVIFIPKTRRLPQP
jgi:hypothetical protein